MASASNNEKSEKGEVLKKQWQVLVTMKRVRSKVKEIKEIGYRNFASRLKKGVKVLKKGQCGVLSDFALVTTVRNK